MDPITRSITIGRPREELFAYLGDIANHSEFLDHFLVDWHLLREQSYGRGAGARFRARMPGYRFSWADLTFVEFESPYAIVGAGKGCKNNRVGVRVEWHLRSRGAALTEVELTVEIEPATLPDRLMESFGAGPWLRLNMSRALRRLRSIFEEGEGRGTRTTVAAA